ncbi:MAG: cysteine peptidase family C39 domain-containing protein [Coprobacillus sp.]|nr:cysteine peptidase family C39 domain-containing protein [Coprobacillus sp.]
MSYFISQETTTDCGFTSLKIILARLNHNKEFLYLPRSRDETSSFYDLKISAEKYGLYLDGYEYQSKEDIYLAPKGYKILQLNREGSKHAIILKRITHKWAYIVDPAYGSSRVKTKALFNEWSGRALLITYFKKYTGKLPTYPLLGKRKGVGLFLSKLFSSLFLLMGLSLIESPYYLLPLGCLAICALFEVLYHVLLNRKMKEIDNSFLSRLKKPLSNKEELKTYEDYKSKALTLPTVLTFSVLLSLLITLLFIFNSLYNLIIIGALLFSLMVKEAFIEPGLTREESKISTLELALSREKDMGQFQRRFTSLHEKTYRYASITTLERYLELFILMLSIIVSMYLEGYLSLTYVLLYFALSYYLKTNLEKVTSLRKERREYDLLKSKYNTMMKRLT